MSTWYQGKLFIERATAVSHDSLHVIFGVVVLLAAALLLRQSVASLRPLLAVLAFALFNEAVDLWVERWPDAAMQYGEGVRDLALTMLLPTILMVAARLRPDLFRQGGRARWRKRR